MMRLKDFVDVTEMIELYVYTIENEQYVTLATPSIQNNFTEYSNECHKLRELAKADEYVVKHIGLLRNNFNDYSCISVEYEKG